MKIDPSQLEFINDFIMEQVTSSHMKASTPVATLTIFTPSGDLDFSFLSLKKLKLLYRHDQKSGHIGPHNIGPSPVLIYLWFWDGEIQMKLTQ